MASDKYFVFRASDVTAFSEVFSNDGRNISVFSVNADKVAYITAKSGAVVIVFDNAGLYDFANLQPTESIGKVKMEIQCEVGSEYQLVKRITQFITADAVNKWLLEFDAVGGTSTFKESNPSSINSLIPSLPVIRQTQKVSKDPQSSDRNGAATTTVAGITFPSASMLADIYYAAENLPAHGQVVGSSNNWISRGLIANNIDGNSSTTPTVNRDNGTNDDALDFDAADVVTLNDSYTVTKDYTMFMVVGAIGYGSFGHSIVANGHTHIGFAAGAGEENTNSEFWVRHNTASTKRPAYMKLDNTDFGTVSYTYPDPRLDDADANSSGFQGQTTYVFVLRRDADMNLYLHNHEGEIVGYVAAKTGQGDFATDGDLVIANLGEGFRGFLSSFGVISQDIGTSLASDLAIDLFQHYRKVY